MLIQFVEKLRALPLTARRPMLTNKEIDSIRDNLCRAKYGMRLFDARYY